jgi:hypothetical protein
MLLVRTARQPLHFFRALLLIFRRTSKYLEQAKARFAQLSAKCYTQESCGRVHAVTSQSFLPAKPCLQTIGPRDAPRAQGEGRCPTGSAAAFRLVPR